MRRCLTALVVATTVAAWWTPAAAAGFAVLWSHSWEGIFTGTRLSGMGGSDIACDDGPGALLVNPAPLLRGNAVAVAHDHVDYPLAGIDGTDGPESDLDYVTTSLAVEWQGWRVSSCISEESLDNALLRTAYLPEGAGTYNHRSRMTLVGLARQLAGESRSGSGLNWTVGIAYRSFSAKTSGNRTDPLVNFDDGQSTGSWDVGTTAAYGIADQAHQASIAAAVAWQNMTEATWAADGREMELPQVVRMGLTAGMTLLDEEREWVRIVAAVARSNYTGEVNERDSSQVGIEVTALRLLAVRLGSNDRFYGGGSTWGLGLVLDHPRGRPFEMAVDYGENSPDNEMFDDVDLAMWSGRVRVDF